MVKKQKKRVIPIIMLAIMLMTAFTFPGVVGAADNDRPTVQPRWTSIHLIDVLITFNGSSGNVTATASKQSTASSISGTLTLYKKVGSSWDYIDQWSGSKTRGTLALEDDFTAVSGTTYKAVFTVTAYTNGVGETETIEYIKTCP